MSIDQALKTIDEFQGDSLTVSLSQIESVLVGLGLEQVKAYCGERSIDTAFMASAASIKRVAGQINVIIHAAGILCVLPNILQPGERVESVSLGAGNAGKPFDLTTSTRVAEFKFIDWQGGPESIRQNSLFMDFFSLAEHSTEKRRYLYVVDTKFPLKFLTGGRALTSVLSRFPSVLEKITKQYPGVTRVRDYYELKKDVVEICDVSEYIGRMCV